jgi:hypothetical protein
MNIYDVLVFHYCQKKKNQDWAGGVAQVVEPEFKSQYHQKTTTPPKIGHPCTCVLCTTVRSDSISRVSPAPSIPGLQGNNNLCFQVCQIAL